MFISHKFKVIFIHIQKTGGNSIQRVFEGFDKDLVKRVPVCKSKKRSKHCFASDIKAVVHGTIFKEYLKFCVVRNPFDRMVSWYSMFRFRTGIKNDVMIAVNKNAKDFDDFLNLPRNHESGLFKRFYVNQLDYISENDRILVDRVLRFESLDSDFLEFAKQIGFRGRLPHENRSIRAKNYRDYYSEKMKAMIFQRFQKDFGYFGYSF